MTSPQFRPLKFGVTRVQLRDGVPGTHYMTAEQPLQPFAALRGPSNRRCLVWTNYNALPRLNQPLKKKNPLQN